MRLASQTHFFAKTAPQMSGDDLSNYTIRSISCSEAQRICRESHYLHRSRPCSVAFALMLGDEPMGVITYGTPASAPLRQGIAGPEHENDVIELTRLWVSDTVPKNGESYLIGRTIKQSGKPIIVSFADTAQSHIGIVYQATNWIYTGLSANRTSWTIDGEDKHGQTIADKYSAQEVRDVYGDRFSLVLRSRKHRYIYLNTSRSHRRYLLARLRYPVLPYPKLPIDDVASSRQIVYTERNGASVSSTHAAPDSHLITQEAS